MNDRRLIALAAFFVGSLLVILIVPSGEGEEESRDLVPTPAGAALSATALPHAATTEQLAAQRRRADRLDWGPDPFISPWAAAPVGPRVGPHERLSQLTGISTKGTDRRALIGNEIVQEGDTLASGYLVVRITKRSVTLRSANGELELSLGEEE